MKPQALLTIGDFSRATHVTVKMLRHYHQLGLLEPAEVDGATGYRRYSTEQIPIAHVIRRFRALAMPLEEIRTVLTTADIAERNAVINSHLARLESQLDETRQAVKSLRELLDPGLATAAGGVTYRRVEATRAVVISEVVDVVDALAWHQGALDELLSFLAAEGVRPNAPAGGIFADELFTAERGRATVFIPIDDPVRLTGRLAETVIPAAELATVVHCGPIHDIDISYGKLADHVAHHAISVHEPIREYYVVGPHDSPDESRWRTEIGWPVFPTNTGRE